MNEKEKSPWFMSADNSNLFPSRVCFADINYARHGRWPTERVYDNLYSKSSNRLLSLAPVHGIGKNLCTISTLCR